MSYCTVSVLHIYVLGLTTLSCKNSGGRSLSGGTGQVTGSGGVARRSGRCGTIPCDGAGCGAAVVCGCLVCVRSLWFCGVHRHGIHRPSGGAVEASGDVGTGNTRTGSGGAKADVGTLYVDQHTCQA